VDTREPQTPVSQKRSTRRDPPWITCGGCDARWTGQSVAHCAACHRSFSVNAHFDLHRSPKGEHGTCLDPATITDSDGNPKLFWRDGLWRGPQVSEDQRRAMGWSS
jgi:hypothetical protein